MISKPLSELCLEVVDCPHSTPKWTTEGHLVIRSQNIRNGRLNLDNKSYTDTENFETRSRRIRLRKDDLIITREAPMGEVCIIPADLECCLGQRMVGLRSNPEVIAPRFLLYALQSPSVKHQISWNEGTGSTVSNMRIPALKALEIPLPNVPDQKAIAHILGTLDDKIELNRKMNETLEEIAKAIFKSWFVDFDPVRAKMEGRPTGLPDDIAALFPDRLVDSEIGEIPEGWAIGCVSEIAELNRKTVSPSKTSDLYEHFSIPAYDNGSSPSIDLGADIKSNKTVVPPEAVLVSKLNPDTPRVWLPRAASDLDQICSTEFMVFTSKGLGSRSFVWSLFCAQSMIAYMKSLVTGTSKSHQRVKPNDILAAKIVLPDSTLIGAFSNVVDPITKRRFVCSKESESLGDLRDTLLPKLISGELQVPDAEKFLEEAGI